MKTNPKTDEQLHDEAMLPEGEYDFSIDKAEDKVSKKGREAGQTEPDMIQLDLTVFSSKGDRRVRDWIVSTMAWKLKHFCYAVGLGEAYERGDISADGLVGRCGKLLLKKGKANGDFAPRNEVKDYIVNGAEKPAPMKVAPQVPAAAKADDIDPPF